MRTSPTISPADYRKLMAARGPSKNKFHAVKVVLADGTVIDSKKEARRLSELRVMERAGEIGDLVLQPSHELIVGGKLICRYKADFSYRILAGKLAGTVVIEDVKGGRATRTPSYRIKKKLFEALYAGLRITEV